MFDNSKEIIHAIEAHHWDHEPEWIPEKIRFADTEDLIMVQNPGVESINANKVTKSVFEDQVDRRIKQVFSFYNGAPFSWWLGPNARPDNLRHLLEEKGFNKIDDYVGLALKLESWQPASRKSRYELKEVDRKDHLAKQVEVSAEVWGYGNETKQTSFRQRQSYLKLSSRRGGFVIALDGNRAVAYSNYRYSEDGKVLYLTGSGVLPEYRKKGIYTDLVMSRMVAAKKKGCEIVTVQARVDTSGPVLRKLGFQEYGKYERLATIRQAEFAPDRR